jgi:hypothetical protein
MKNKAGVYSPFKTLSSNEEWRVDHHLSHHRPGAIVNATIAAVESALSEVAPNLKSDYLGIEVINGNQSASWPICMVSFAMVSVANNLSDCSYIQGLLKFIAWSQLNPRVIAGVKSDLNMVPLPFGYKTYTFANPPPPLFFIFSTNKPNNAPTTG